MDRLTALRSQIVERRFWPEEDAIADNLEQHGLSAESRGAISAEAASLIAQIRAAKSPGLMETFLAEYNLSTKEGVALMCLAEAYLRTPDAPSLDALIRDKIGPGNWESHRAHARSPLVNASTWALMLTGRLFREVADKDDDLIDNMRRAVQRLGEPVARTAVEQAMKVMGRQFVLGRNIGEALDNGAERMAEGYSYSFDMLGEAARTDPDARRYFLAYSKAIGAIAEKAGQPFVHDNPGISIKLSALHPRYETLQRERVMHELTPRLLALAVQARAANIGLNVDAEEADRLELSLEVYETVLRNPDLAGWDGFGLVVQAYSKQAPAVLAWIEALARDLGRQVPVRLVKGAYWDAEIKNAQVLGLASYPVYSRKVSTDLSYLRCAQQLLSADGAIYPQFATHNAHTVAAILEMAQRAGKEGRDAFEFQRLHGMGESLHAIIKKSRGHRCRIYAPVGVHKDLLAYLVRRLLENGANSSFVNQVLDDKVPPATIAKDPVVTVESLAVKRNPHIPLPADLYGETRRNALGLNLNNPHDNAQLDAAMERFRHVNWLAKPLVAGKDISGEAKDVASPSNADDKVGQVIEASAEAVEAAIATAVAAASSWGERPVEARAAILERIADLYEEHMPELIAIGCREAGKTRLDGVLEVREAVDFCRYYAAEARRIMGNGGSGNGERRPLGPVACISPWNFPLAIFTGQITAALVAGNPVLAKPAEQTPLMAGKAVSLMHDAGVPPEALALLPGDGATVGRALTSDPRIKGCCFTGSTETAALIDRAMAGKGDPAAPLIAETGGLNAMIVDSTALPEQAVRDIVQSAFQSAGQRCSALRVLFVQEDVAGSLLTMLEGAAKQLSIGDPWLGSTDVGPVIDDEAKAVIEAHCAALEADDRRLFALPIPAHCRKGHFVGPAAFRLNRFEDLTKEIFGPVLHVLTYRAADLDKVVDQINASGYGLTLGVHSRVDGRIDQVCERAHVGNIYVNRNQIGAVVGVQPFGGEGLSGTGPKAGGPSYLYRFSKPLDDGAPIAPAPREEEMEEVLPGPTGEMNTLHHAPRGPVACLGCSDGKIDGNDEDSLLRQAAAASEAGNPIVFKRSPAAEKIAAETGAQNGADISLDDAPEDLPGIRAVLYDGDDEGLRSLRQRMAERDGVRIPVLRCDRDATRWLSLERVVSEDTTASGGNTTLLAEAEAGTEK